MLLASLLFVVSLAPAVIAQLSSLTTTFLNLTAIAAEDGESLFQCWQLECPFAKTAQSGISGSLQLSLGAMGIAKYSVIPARFDGGYHHAPAFQYVLFSSGLVHVSLYKGDEEIWIQGGKYGLIIAADTADRTNHGHRTRYPSDSDTIALQLPIKDRENFKYKVLHSGACHDWEMIGI